MVCFLNFLLNFNYLGQFDTTTGYWQVVGEASGRVSHPENLSDTVININGMVVEGQLQFHIATRLSSTESQAFTEALRVRLHEVIHHCVTQVEHEHVCHTPSDFPLAVISETTLDALQKQYDIEAIYPASSLQQGFIYHALSHPEDDAYHVQLLFDYEAQLDVALYQQAWLLALETYAPLRMCFNWEEELLQVVVKQNDLNFTLHGSTDFEDPSERVKRIQVHDRTQAFDLTQPRLLRLHLIEHDAASYTLLLSVHHGILDGWSSSFLLRAVHRYYDALCLGQSPVVTPDSAYNRTQAYIARHQEEDNSYWRDRLAQMEHPNNLSVLLTHPCDLDAVRVVASPGLVSLSVVGAEYDAIKHMTTQLGLTLNVIAQFAWHKLIQVYTGDTQTIVGTVVSGRALPIADLACSVGPYVNTLPLIITWNASSTIQEQLKAIHEHIDRLNIHAMTDLSSLQKDGQRLFHSLLTFDNYPGLGEDVSESQGLVAHACGGI